MAACPGCNSDGALGIARRITLPGDRRADEIALEILACGCGFKAVAVVEQPRRAALRGGAPERVGYRLPAAAVDLLADLIARCPEPAEEYCPCPAHTTLNRRDLRNQWNLLHSFAPFAGFALPPAIAPARAGFACAPLAWTRNGAGYRAVIDDREWRLSPAGEGAACRYTLAAGNALDLELDRLPAFWLLGDVEQEGGETGKVKEEI